MCNEPQGPKVHKPVPDPRWSHGNPGSKPTLSEMALIHTDVVETPTRSFKHAGVKKLTVKLEQLFPVHSVGPSLLSYFPNLKTLSTWNHKSSFVFPTAKINDDITRYCPLLTGLLLSDRLGTFVPNFCCHVIRHLSSIVFEFDQFSTQSIMALLLHQATLKQSGIFFHQSITTMTQTNFLQCRPISKNPVGSCSSSREVIRDWRYWT